MSDSATSYSQAVMADEEVPEKSLPPLCVDIVFGAVLRDPSAGRPVTQLLERWGALLEDVDDLAAQVRCKLVKAALQKKELRHELLYTGYLQLTDFRRVTWDAADCEYSVRFDPAQLSDIKRARPDLLEGALVFARIEEWPAGVIIPKFRWAER